MDISSLFTTPGIGGLVVTAVMTIAAVTYVSLTIWALRGGRDDDPPWEHLGWPFD
jgi:hypothetical protein